MVSSLTAAALLVPRRAKFGFLRKQKYSFPAGYLFVLEQTVKATWLWGVKGETADQQLWGGRKDLFHP